MQTTKDCDNKNLEVIYPFLAIDDCYTCYEIKNHYQIYINYLADNAGVKFKQLELGTYVRIGHQLGEQ